MKSAAILLVPALLLLTAAAPDQYRQPVRAGDLAGRALIAPTEAQDLLGHVERVDGTQASPALRIRTWSLIPWNRRTVEVPLDSVALVGELVALVGLTPEQLAALPNAANTAPVPADQTLQVSLRRPFH